MCSFEIRATLSAGLSRDEGEDIRRAVVSLLELWDVGSREEDAGGSCVLLVEVGATAGVVR
ncbi:hypothetical protein [Saccharothrix longispora]|uniref:hypothetical protein n=1 Tax=Saccharothrix longispora TaxID=33920 RepID=UPI0028FD5DB1|nr:hypothetical protein [Saccharothrix longispora]MDU0294377.1 hypothetical protein [Saccharothrix longispora]